MFSDSMNREVCAQMIASARLYDGAECQQEQGAERLPRLVMAHVPRLSVPYNQPQTCGNRTTALASTVPRVMAPSGDMPPSVIEASRCSRASRNSLRLRRRKLHDIVWTIQKI